MKYLFIVNTTSGKKQKKQYIASLEQGLGNDLELVYPSSREEAQKLAKTSVHDMIIIGGGDGTVNAVVNGIMEKKGEKPVIAIVPLGTSNIAARSLELTSKKPEELVELIKARRSRMIDIGKANHCYFVNGCGIGLDAHAYSHVEPKLKQYVGEAAYPISLLKSMVDYKPEELIVAIDENQKKAYYVLVCNIVRVNKFFTLIKTGRDYDGLFEVLLFQKKNLLDNLRYLYGIVSQRHHLFKDIEHVRCNALKITSQKPVLTHVDAEANGTTPVEIKMYSQALEIIC